MPDRVSSDHDSIQTHRAALENVGRTDRAQVVLPTEAVGPDRDGGVDDVATGDVAAGDVATGDVAAGDVTTGDVVEFALDGDTHYARIGETLDGDLVVRRATDNRRQAREGDGENRLAGWIEDADVTVGGSVHLDVVTPGHAYGVRTPGTRVVYTVTEPPDDSLADIAADLDGE